MATAKSAVEFAIRSLVEECQAVEASLNELNAKGGEQLWYMALVDGGPDVGSVSVSNLGFLGSHLLRFWGVTQAGEDVQLFMHADQLRFAIRVVPREQAPSKRPIGFGAGSEPGAGKRPIGFNARVAPDLRSADPVRPGSGTQPPASAPKRRRG
jgi:hypothetical protein